jgi:hypothetical protein
MRVYRDHLPRSGTIQGRSSVVFTVATDSTRLRRAVPDYSFKTTKRFESVAQHLSKYHGISPALASNRLHALKEFRGLSGNIDVVFDFTGGVHIDVDGSLEYLGTLTTGGAKERA